MSVQAKSGSELLLGVRSDPKTRLSLSVCPLSSTICVYRTAKWFNPFVRGTFGTETSLLTFELIRSTIWKKWTATVLHFSNVRPLIRGRPQLVWGWTATVLRFQMLLVPDVRQSNARNQFAVLSVPHPAAQPQALNLGPLIYVGKTKRKPSGCDIIFKGLPSVSLL